MTGYLYILALHIVSAVLWLAMIPADIVLRKFVLDENAKNGQRKVVSAWLKILNLTGMSGMTGLLITGILLVIQHPTYGFFKMSSDHWLATKQIIMVVLIVMTGMYFIPLGKKVRLALGSDLENNEPLAADAYANIRKLASLSKIMGALVLLNFIFGILHNVVRVF